MGKRKHGRVNEIRLGKTEERLMGLIQELVAKLGRTELSYGDLRDGGWNVSPGYTRVAIRRLAKKSLLTRPRKGYFSSALPRVIPLVKESPESRKYLALIEEKIRTLSSNKEKLEEELKTVNRDIAHWEEIKQEITQHPELVKIVEELKKLEG